MQRVTYPIENNIAKYEKGRLAETIAREAGISRAHYYLIRSGRIIPSVIHVGSLCQVFGCQPAELFPTLFNMVGEVVKEYKKEFSGDVYEKDGLI